MIVVRKAGLPDLSSIVAFGKGAVARSSYAEIAPFNSVSTRQFIKTAIAAHDMEVFIALREGDVCGVLIASVDMVLFSHVLMATDLAFAATAGGDKLLDAFIAWAKHKRAVFVEMVSSQAQNFESFGKLLRRKGFTRSGSVFRKMLREDAMCP